MHSLKMCFKRRDFMSFRISSHKLEIERGQYKQLPVKDRLCKLCKSGAVEDEKHFIFSCKLYSSLRQTFFADVKNHVKTFQVYRRMTSSFGL